MPQPGDIDLNTAEGRAMFERVQRGDLSDFAPKPVQIPKPPPPWQEMLYRLLCHERPDLEWKQNHKPFPDRKWELDISVVAILFAVEVDGGIHYKESQRISDAQKTRRCQREGWRLTRVVNQELKQNPDATLREVLAELTGWERRA